MLIGKRNFPYPILNRNQALTNYTNDTSFKLVFEFDENAKPFMRDGKMVFKSLHYELNDATLCEYISCGLVCGTFIVESSASAFRERYDISPDPVDLEIPFSEFYGNVSVSCYLIANSDIKGFRSEGFNSVYQGYSFDIDKFDILAADDGYKFKIDNDEREDDKVASIFIVVKKDNDDGLITYDTDEKNIIIKLPKSTYAYYDTIKRRSNYNNIAFAMMAIPALAFSIANLQNQYSDFTDLEYENRWFTSVRNRYEVVFNKNLTLEELNTGNAYSLAQTVLNNGSCLGIRDFGEMIIGIEGGEVEDE